MTGGPALLICAALLLAAAVAGIARALLPGGASGRRLAARLASSVRPHARAGGGTSRAGGAQGGRLDGAGSGASSAGARLPPGAARAAAAVFGWSPERRDQYPLPPLAVVALAAPAAAALALGAAALFGPGLRPLALALWPLLSRAAFARWHRRRAAALYAQLPDALAMIVRAVRAGIPVVEALRTVGRELPDPTGAEFRRLSDQVAIGIPLETALRVLSSRSGLPEYGFFAVALTLQNAAGGNLTDTLDNLADVVRRRVAMRLRGHALASQARASAYILAAVPVLTCGALLVLNPGYILALFDDPRGRAIFGAALCSLAVGLGSMRLVIARSLS